MLCFECRNQATQNHHVVPKSLGGTKTIPLCYKCHNLVHNINNGNLLKLKWKHHRENGLKVGGKTPYGFDVDKDRKLIPNKTEQQVIRKIIALRSSGKSLREICKYLLDNGIKTKTGLSWWSSKTVKTILDKNGRKC